MSRTAMSLPPRQSDSNLSADLGQIALFRDLPATDLRQISERLHSKVFTATRRRCDCGGNSRRTNEFE